MWRRPVAPPVRRTEGRAGLQQLLTTASPRPALVRMDPCTALYRQPHCSVADLCHVLGPDPEATVPRAAEYLEEAGVAGGRSGPAVVPAVLGHHALRPQAGREEGALHPGTVEHRKRTDLVTGDQEPVRRPGVVGETCGGRAGH